MRPLEHIIDTELLRECLQISNQLSRFKNDFRTQDLTKRLEGILNEGFLTKTQICIEWDALDIQYIRPDLTENEAMDVLIYTQENHDKAIGVNYDVIKNHCSTLFPIQK